MVETQARVESLAVSVAVGGRRGCPYPVPSGHGAPAGMGLHIMSMYILYSINKLEAYIYIDYISYIEYIKSILRDLGGYASPVRPA